MFVICWKENPKRLLGTIEYNFWLSFSDHCQQHYSRVSGIGEMGALKHSFKKAYQHYHEEIIKNEYFDTLDDE